MKLPLFIIITSAFAVLCAIVSYKKTVNNIEATITEKVSMKLHPDTANCYIQGEQLKFSFELEK